MESNSKEIPPQIKELHAYIDSLFEQMDVAMSARKAWMKWEMIALVAQIGSIFIHFAPFMIAANVAFWTVFLYGMMFLTPRVSNTAAEIDGCFKTLEILGMIEKNPFGGKRKKRTLADLFAPIVRAWGAAKEKAQKELWGEGVAAPMPVAARV